MAQVAQIRKMSSDVCRLTIDLTVAGSVLPTLDPGEGANYQWLNTETVVGFQTPTVTAGPGIWAPVPPPTTTLPPDPSPVTVTSCTIVDSNTAIQLFIANGSAGYSYVVQVIAQDSVGRFVTLQVIVTLMGLPATPATPVATVTPGALPLLGGTMLGPLYLYESPLTGTEAATKAYVDAAIANGFTTAHLVVTGSTTLSGTVTLPGNVTVGGTLGVTGAATLSSTLAVSSNATVGGTFGATGNTTVGGTLGVTGAATLSSTLAVTGNTTVGGTLGVTGAATLSSTLGVTGVITPSGGIKGTTAGTNQTTGNIGEVIQSGNTGGGGVTVTISIANPCVVTSTAHGIQGIAAVQFATSGALPTGLSASVTYYAVPDGPNQLFIANSIGNAAQASYITTTGTQSGTQTMYQQAIATSTVVADIAAVVIGAGDWEVYADASVNTGGQTVTVATFWISTVSATNPSPPGFGQKAQWLGSSTSVPVLTGMKLRVLTNAQETVYLSGVVTAGGTTGMGGSIVARRVV